MVRVFLPGWEVTLILCIYGSLAQFLLFGFKFSKMSDTNSQVCMFYFVEEYISLYQTQRGILVERTRAHEEYASQLSREKADLQEKLLLLKVSTLCKAN